MALWESALRGQIDLGGDAFVQRMQALAESADNHEVPRRQRQHALRPVDWYRQQHQRDQAIVLAYRDGCHTQTVIARATTLSVSRISRLIAQDEAKGKT